MEGLKASLRVCKETAIDGDIKSVRVDQAFNELTKLLANMLVLEVDLNAVIEVLNDSSPKQDLG